MSSPLAAFSPLCPPLTVPDPFIFHHDMSEFCDFFPWIFDSPLPLLDPEVESGILDPIYTAALSGLPPFFPRTFSRKVALGKGSLLWDAFFRIFFFPSPGIKISWQHPNRPRRLPRLRFPFYFRETRELYLPLSALSGMEVSFVRLESFRTILLLIGSSSIFFLIFLLVLYASDL